MFIGLVEFLLVLGGCFSLKLGREACLMVFNVKRSVNVILGMVFWGSCILVAVVFGGCCIPRVFVWLTWAF